MPTVDSLTSGTAAYFPEARGLRAPAGNRIDYRSRPPLGRVDRRRRRVGADWILSALARGSGGIILLLMAALICVLGYSALPSLKTFGPRFLVTATWRPNELEHVKRDAHGKIVK